MKTIGEAKSNIKVGLNEIMNLAIETWSNSLKLLEVVEGSSQSSLKGPLISESGREDSPLTLLQDSPLTLLQGSISFLPLK